MPPKRGKPTGTTISAMVDSSDDDISDEAIVLVAGENKSQPRARGGGRTSKPAASAAPASTNTTTTARNSKTTMPPPKKSQPPASSKKAPASAAKPTRSRKAPQKPVVEEALSDAVEEASSEEEAEEEEDEIESVQEEEEDTRRGRQKKGTAAASAKSAPTTRNKSKTRSAKGKPQAVEVEDDSILEEESTPRRSKRDPTKAGAPKSTFRPPSPPVVHKKKPATAAKGRTTKKANEKPVEKLEIQETQFDPLPPVPESEDELAGKDNTETNVKKRAAPTDVLPPAKRRNARDASVDKVEEAREVARIRNGVNHSVSPEITPKSSAVATVSVNEAALKHQIDNLQQKFNQLSALRLTDPEKALEDYKTVMEARLKTAEKLTTALQDSSKATKKIQDEVNSLKKQLASKDAQISKDAATIASLEKQNKEQQSEISVLEAKLAASRVPPKPDTFAHPQVHGSAIKPKHSSTNSVANAINTINGITSSSSSAAAWLQKAKEELYSDLSGVSILDVRETKEEPQARVYTCLLTGNNGSLHFKLATPLAFGSGEDMITFTPMLDLTTGRDTKVAELLPEYMRDEIGFSRTHTTRFFLRVLDVMMTTPEKRMDRAKVREREQEVEDDDDEEEEEEEDDDEEDGEDEEEEEGEEEEEEGGEE